MGNMNFDFQALVDRLPALLAALTAPALLYQVGVAGISAGHLWLLHRIIMPLRIRAFMAIRSTACDAFSLRTLQRVLPWPRCWSGAGRRGHPAHDAASGVHCSMRRCRC